MHERPSKQHVWLEQLVGEWVVTSKATLPDEKSASHESTETVRSLGGMWVLCEGKMSMPDGSTGTTLMTLGYDPAKSKYVGTFIGSMMANLWIYEGTLDSDGKMLLLDTTGPSFTGDGTIVPYRDTITIESPDHRVLTSAAPNASGEWQQFLTAHYRKRA